MSATMAQSEAAANPSPKPFAGLNLAGASRQSSGALQYVMHTKALLGLAVIVFAIYLFSNDVPLSWNNYQAGVQKVQQAEQQRQAVLNNLSRLQSTSKNIKPLDASIYKLNGAESPEIATLRIAQDITRLAQSSKNKYVSITPMPAQKVDFSKVVDIAINPDSASTAPANADQNAAPAAQDSAAQGVQPVDPTAEDASSEDDKPANPATTVQTNVYVLKIKGTMRTLAEFIYQLTSYETLIFLQKVRIGTGDLASASEPGIGLAAVQGTPNVTGDATGGAANASDITMELTFQIPWSQ